MLDKIVSAIGNFLLVFFLLTVAWAVSETAGYFNPQPLALRKTLVFAMVAASAAFAVWRWRRAPAPERTDAARGKALAAQDAADERLAQRVGALSKRAVPPPATATAARAPDDGLPPAVTQAARQAIVFRQFFPPAEGADSLSFWGGTPVASASFAWPRAADGSALSFLMQVDCSDIPERGRLGLLPAEGTLHFFLDLEWGAPHVCVMHVGGGGGRTEIEPPADLKPAFGSEAKYLSPWAASDSELPRLLPKWPFNPVVIDVPAEEGEDGEDDSPPMAPGESAMATALLAAQGDGAVPSYFEFREFLREDGRLERPFPAYPHDWRAVQTMAAEMRQRAQHAVRYNDWLYRDLPKEEREAMLAGILESADGWLQTARLNSPFEAVPEGEAGRFWAWVQGHSSLALHCIENALTRSIEDSLAASSAATARIPAEAISRILHRHVLAWRRDGAVLVNMPDRMLAAPSDVQGNQYEIAQTHLLLLEISSNEGLRHHFGEGVYQFWITPDDLKARRFDQVVLTADAY